MSIRTSTVIAAPIDEVFAWHERPGALTRLTPPWQPVTVVREPENLRDGRAELRLPGRVVWVAQHSGYEPPQQFVDTLSSLPLQWRHLHRFERLDADTTQVLDIVDTPIPERLLRATFAYRQRQLADDLAVARRMPPKAMTVAMTGSSGLVGTALTALLGVCGHRVIRLVRRPASASDEREWRPDRPDRHLLNDVDAVVHLAGASIAGRFTAEHKRQIYDSRIAPTRRLAELIADNDRPIPFVCASAIGYYGPDRGPEILDEDSEAGGGFLADLVSRWEAAATPVAAAGGRVVQVRTGIVQSPKGGILRLLRPLFSAGVGGRLGDGRQWVSWIDLDDLCDIYLRALLDPTLVGPVNATAPQPVTNREYTHHLAGVLRRPALLAVPAIAPKMLLGEQGATEFALAGQRVLPARLTQAGQQFRRPELVACLRHQLGRFGS